MIGFGGAIEAVGGLANTLIERLIPDPEAKAEAKRKLAEMQLSGELEHMKTQMSAIIAEAQSQDPWTSRARPTFLYVMYALMLWSVPMGILSAFHPDIAARITEGMTGYLRSIPGELYALFGTGYLGYATLRQWGKVKGTDR